MLATSLKSETLAVNGGPKSVLTEDSNLFRWPIVTPEDEQAVLEVVRAGRMSAWDITEKFESEWGQYIGTRFNLAHCNGTMALLAAMYGVGIGAGDEIIVPSVTYWASAMPVRLLGGTPVLADIHPETLCIDPGDIERLITPRTRAIVAVHYCGHPADMDPIMSIAARHNLRVIEDGSHAHGTLYKGRMCGSIGDVSACSMMTLKSFAIGEAGMLSTNDRTIYERAIAYCHYERIGPQVLEPGLRSKVVSADGKAAFPAGGLKGRVNQTCTAMGRVQLKYYPERIREIQGAINRFWDLLEGVPGMRAHRPARGEGSTMGGWYNPVGHYLPEELGGLDIQDFIDRVNAEGGRTGRGLNYPMHLHPQFADVKQRSGNLKVSENIHNQTFGIPYFKKDDAEKIAQYANAFRKVAENADEIKRARSAN